MVRWQVVGILDSYLSNRQNEFPRIVECASLPGEAKHPLHFVNRWKGWFGREPLAMKGGDEIPADTRALARHNGDGEWTSLILCATLPLNSTIGAGGWG